MIEKNFYLIWINWKIVSEVGPKNTWEKVGPGGEEKLFLLLFENNVCVFIENNFYVVVENNVSIVIGNKFIPGWYADWKSIVNITFHCDYESCLRSNIFVDEYTMNDICYKNILHFVSWVHHYIQ